MSNKKKLSLSPTRKDLRIFEYMSKVGGVSYESLQKRFNYSAETIRKRFAKLPYIQRQEEKIIEDNKEVTRYVYTFNKEGKSFMLKAGKSQHCSNYFGYEHFLKLEKTLFSLVGRDEMFDKNKDSEYKTSNIDLRDILGEAEQRFLYEKEINKLKSQDINVSVIDFLYKDSSGDWIGIEVETSNYRKTRREAHYNYVTHILGLSADNYKIVK